VEVARDVRTASHVVVNERLVPVDHGLALEADIVPAEARVLLEAVVGGRRIPFLTEHHVGDSRVAVLNTHTYSQADFDAVGEVLLAPRPLGLLEIPLPWAEELRRVFAEPDSAGFQAPTKVTLQPLGTRGWFIQNYNEHPVNIELTLNGFDGVNWMDGFSRLPIPTEGDRIKTALAPRSRWWIYRE
jgi:hypothetical protein